MGIFPVFVRATLTDPYPVPRGIRDGITWKSALYRSMSCWRSWAMIGDFMLPSIFHWKDHHWFYRCLPSLILSGVRHGDCHTSSENQYAVCVLVCTWHQRPRHTHNCDTTHRALHGARAILSHFLLILEIFALVGPRWRGSPGHGLGNNGSSEESCMVRKILGQGPQIQLIGYPEAEIWFFGGPYVHYYPSGRRNEKETMK